MSHYDANTIHKESYRIFELGTTLSKPNRSIYACKIVNNPKINGEV